MAEHFLVSDQMPKRKEPKLVVSHFQVADHLALSHVRLRRKDEKFKISFHLRWVGVVAADEELALIIHRELVVHAKQYRLAFGLWIGILFLRLLLLHLISVSFFYFFEI